MAAPRLQDGEKICFTAHPGSWGLAGIYVFTLGLYRFWRRATYFVVTDQQVIRSKGLVSKSQQTVPLEMIQDARFVTVLGIGGVLLSTAGGAMSVQKLSPMKASTAHEMIELILTERKRARQPVQSVHQSPNVMEQLKQLGELRDAGVLSADEFDAKKSELLGRV